MSKEYLSKESLIDHFARGYVTDERYDAITKFLLDIQTRPDYYCIAFETANDIAYLASIGLLSLGPSSYGEELHDE